MTHRLCSPDLATVFKIPQVQFNTLPERKENKIELLEQFGHMPPLQAFIEGAVIHKYNQQKDKPNFC